MLFFALRLQQYCSTFEMILNRENWKTPNCLSWIVPNLQTVLHVLFISRTSLFNVTNITIVLVFNKVTLQSTHWSIQTLFISGGDSSCSWVFCSCTGPKCGVGVDLVDCNAVGGGHVATSIDQSVRISACGALALEEYKQSASVQPLLCNS